MSTPHGVGIKLFINQCAAPVGEKDAAGTRVGGEEEERRKPGGGRQVCLPGTLTDSLWFHCNSSSTTVSSNQRSATLSHLH